MSAAAAVTAAGLKVEELRSQLSSRGLDTSGTKPLLVRRLEAALRKEQKKEKDEEEEEEEEKKRRKRSRDDGGDSVVGEAEKLARMSMRELRQHATSEGIAADGLKKAEIVERLLASERNGSRDADQYGDKVEAQQASPSFVGAPPSNPISGGAWRSPARRASTHSRTGGASSTGKRRRSLPRSVDKQVDLLAEMNSNFTDHLIWNQTKDQYRRDMEQADYDQCAGLLKQLSELTSEQRRVVLEKLERSSYWRLFIAYARIGRQDLLQFIQDSCSGGVG